MSSGLIANQDAINDALRRARELAASSNPAQKRPNSSDDLNFRPAKKAMDGRMGGPNMGSQESGTEILEIPDSAVGLAMDGRMGGPNMGSQESGTEILEIPDSAVGLVIGRGGEQIAQIQLQSGCKVQMAQAGTPQGTRHVTLTGTGQQMEQAKAMINDVVSRANGGGGARGGPISNQFRPPGGFGQPNPGLAANRMSSIELVVTPDKCGLIIGKGGETIKSLQEQLGVKMLLVQESSAISGPKPLKISGQADKVENARRIVEQMLATNDVSAVHKGGLVGKSMGEVIVPRSAVGVIIGKGGEVIKRIANETGTKIQFKNDEDQNANERTAVIQGSPDQITRATQMISDLIFKSGGAGGGGMGGGSQIQETFYMHVPAGKTGLVIGKGGETIKQINGESGAHVELSRDPPPNQNEKIFVIKGTPYQIHHAKHLIRIKVGDVPQGTPVPPFQGPAQTFNLANGPIGNFGGGGDQFGGIPGVTNTSNSWNSNGFNQQPNDSIWTQYYQQQQQQPQQFPYVAPAQPVQTFMPQPQQFQPQPQPTLQQQQPLGGIQPLGTQQPQQAPMGMQVQPQVQPQQQQPAANQQANVNPQTGQPDYSAQWIEYYRSIGMHEQAALIEAQIKQQQQGGQPQQAQQQPQVMGNPMLGQAQPQQQMPQQQAVGGAYFYGRQ
uniref:K Homology domain-containing protein n=2 Tax=Acrobeloides nanus TaxID=290746 RepID=A0A914C2S4_9BILA